MPPYNPFSTDQDEPTLPDRFDAPTYKGRVIQPLSTREELRQAANEPLPLSGRDEAVALIRQKLDAIFAEEPNAEAELVEADHHHKPPSKHQQYLAQLHATATSIADVQTKWHEYYTNLSEDEKREVWQEFEAEQAQHNPNLQTYNKPNYNLQPSVPEPEQVELPKPIQATPPSRSVVSVHEIATPSAAHKRTQDARSAREIKETIRENAIAPPSKSKQNFHSIMFGLGMGAVVMLVTMFSFFNEMIIAPFIQPSRSVSATPIILSSDSIVTDGEPKIIIPKINVEIPVDYSLTSLEEDVVQKGLENGVVHYPVTSNPGEAGNSAFFGHSSNNIFNPGQYKFAFVLLSKLEDGDMFYLTYEDKVYAYRVFRKQIVEPTDTWVLGAVQGKKATATLITCDPPGTTLKRLVVWGEQISPDPSALAAAPEEPVAEETPDLPGAPKTLWQRLFDF